MDIWQEMYEKAQALYQPQEVSDFVYARHVVAAVEAEDGQIFRLLYGRDVWCFPPMC